LAASPTTGIRPPALLPELLARLLLPLLPPAPLLAAEPEETRATGGGTTTFAPSMRPPPPEADLMLLLLNTIGRGLSPLLLPTELMAAISDTSTASRVPLPAPAAPLEAFPRPWPGLPSLLLLLLLPLLLARACAEAFGEIVGAACLLDVAVTGLASASMLLVLPLLAGRGEAATAVVMGAEATASLLLLPEELPDEVPRRRGPVAF